MKALFILLLLVSCQESNTEKIVADAQLVRDVKCQEAVEQMEASLQFMNPSNSYDICDIDLRHDVCPCGGVEKLPLNCSETVNNIVMRFAPVQDNIDGFKLLVKVAKKNKAKKESIKMLSDMLKTYEDEYKILDQNLKSYMRLCDENGR